MKPIESRLVREIKREMGRIKRQRLHRKLRTVREKLAAAILLIAYLFLCWAIITFICWVGMETKNPVISLGFLIAYPVVFFILSKTARLFTD